MGNMERSGWICVVVVAAALALAATSCSSDNADDAGRTTTTTTAPAAGTSKADTAGTAGTAGTASSASSAGGEFSVLSYNVAGLPAEISKENPKEHLPLISPKLDDFDVVLTQEDFDWWAELASGFDFVNYHARLRAEATHEYQSEKHPGPDAVKLDLSNRPAPEVGDGLGVLSRFPIEGNTRVPWPGCFGGFDTADGGAGDCLSMKGFSLTRLTLADGAVVDLYDLHGEAGGTPADQALQKEGFAQLAAYIAEQSKGHAVILGGDTNLHTDMEHPDGSNGADIEIWDQFLKATGLTDSCTATTCPEPGRIDKIAFRSGEGVDLEAVSHAFHAAEFVDTKGQPLSDHDPLEVVFRWKAA